MVRIIATVPKAAFAGVMLENSLARLRPSMAIFNVERSPSRPLGWCDLSFIVEAQGSDEKAVSCETVPETL